jgi:ATP-dependent DNA ligase
MAIPPLIKPMLAKGGGKPFDDDHYGFEVKWDGVRALVIADDPYRIQNRHLNIVSRIFPELNFPFLPKGTVLDGEIVVLKSGVPSFQAIQRRSHMQDETKIRLAVRSIPASFMTFDLLYFNGESVENRPLHARRVLLQDLLKKPREHLILADQIHEHGIAYFNAVAERGLEGVIAKRLDSRYMEGKRSPSWIKIVAWRIEPLQVLGYVKEPHKDRVKQVAVGKKIKGTWNFMGKIGSFDASDREHLYTTLSNAPPLSPPPKGGPRDIQWRDIDLRCHVRYFQETATGRLRHASFRGWAK